MKVVHLTSVHKRYDTRIFFKECISLVTRGYEVCLIVADGNASLQKDGIIIYDVGSPKGRLDRMINIPELIFEKALDLDAEIYHLHDPELLPIGLKLKKKGKKVVFDAHEDTPKQILSKSYLKFPFKLIISNLFKWYEQYACRQLDAVIGATPYIRDKFLKMNIKSIDINNYPLINEVNEISSESINWLDKQNKVCYVGALTKVRGIAEIVQATKLTKNSIKLQIAGSFSDTSFEYDTYQLKGWENVDFLGWLDRNSVKCTMQSSVAGLVTLYPIVNYCDALPVKMFEYMSMGIPVIASNIPLWKNILEEEKSGICVNPLSIIEIAQAIDYLLDNPLKAKEMGENGQKAIKNKYNWSIEEKKLFSLYDELTSV